MATKPLPLSRAIRRDLERRFGLYFDPDSRDGAPFGHETLEVFDRHEIFVGTVTSPNLFFTEATLLDALTRLFQQSAVALERAALEHRHAETGDLTAVTLSDLDKTHRFFLKDDEDAEVEVDAATWRRAEERAGFFPKPGCGPLATAGFSKSENERAIAGRIERRVKKPSKSSKKAGR